MRIARAAGLLLAAVLLLVWVVPAVAGPRVECVDVDPTRCEEAWRETAARQGGIEALLPVTYVRVEGSCPHLIRIERAYTGIFGASVTPLC